MSDTVITITESKNSDQYNYAHPTPEYDSPQAYEPISGSKSVAVTNSGQRLENISLRAANNWMASWSDLPKANGDTPYYYTVKETVTIPGYKTTYLNNSGIQTGIIYITNQKEDDKITLPETGGTGTYWYTMGGVLLTAGAAFLIYKKHMQKGGKRIW